jgi:hypothetical protein
MIFFIHTGKFTAMTNYQLEAQSSIMSIDEGFGSWLPRAWQ